MGQKGMGPFVAMVTRKLLGWRAVRPGGEGVILLGWKMSNVTVFVMSLARQLSQCEARGARVGSAVILNNSPRTLRYRWASLPRIPKGLDNLSPAEK